METPSKLNPHNGIPTESLELLRNKLNQVYQSLRKLADQINYANRHPKGKLPSFPTLHGQFQVLITQLHTIAFQLDTNESVLRSSSVYPLPNFPTTQHEGLITTLLRKKPLPDVDEWINAALNENQSFQILINKDNEFAEWCHLKIKELEEEFNFDGFQTESDLKNLNSQKNHEPEKRLTFEEIQATKHTPMTPNEVMRFMTKGAKS